MRMEARMLIRLAMLEHGIIAQDEQSVEEKDKQPPVEESEEKQSEGDEKSDDSGSSESEVDKQSEFKKLVIDKVKEKLQSNGKAEDIVIVSSDSSKVSKVAKDIGLNMEVTEDNVHDVLYSLGEMMDEEAPGDEEEKAEEREKPNKMTEEEAEEAERSDDNQSDKKQSEEETENSDTEPVKKKDNSKSNKIEKEVKEKAEDVKEKAEDVAKAMNTEDVVELFNRVVEMVTLLIKANPPRIRRKSSDNAYMENVIDRMADRYLRVATQLVVAADKDIPEGYELHVFEKGPDEGKKIYRTKKQVKGEYHYAPVEGEKYSVDRFKKKKEEPGTEKPVEKQFESFGNADSVGTAKWHNSEEPLDVENEGLMAKRGFTKIEPDSIQLDDDMQVADIKTGKIYRFGDLPQEFQDRIKSIVATKGAWRAPTDAVLSKKPNEESEKPKAESEKPKVESKKIDKAKSSVGEIGKVKDFKELISKFNAILKDTGVDEGFAKFMQSYVYNLPESEMAHLQGKTTREIMELVMSEMLDGYASTKAASMRSAAIAERLAEDLIALSLVRQAVRGLQVKRKDKDTMSDTGGSSKGRQREPEIKPPRDDLKKHFRKKRKRPGEMDKDVDCDPDKRPD